MITLFRQCSLADLDVLREFSRQRYLETFAHLNTPENMAAYLDEAFAEERMRTELSNPDSSFHFLYWDDRLAGYIKLNEAGAQTDVHDEQSLELERIYISKEFQGHGLRTGNQENGDADGDQRLSQADHLGIVQLHGDKSAERSSGGNPDKEHTGKAGCGLSRNPFVKVQIAAGP